MDMLPRASAAISVAFTLWVLSAAILMQLEMRYQKGGPAEHFSSLPEAIFRTCIYLTGSWQDIDFAQGAGSRVVIFYCLFAIPVFNIPVAMVVESALAAVQTVVEEHRN